MPQYQTGKRFWKFLKGILIPLFVFSNAQSQTYNFRNYSVEHGLPFIQVYTIFQDSKGNLWSGGYGGLSRFNGKTFTNYSPRNGLADHWVTSITEDKKGNLWVGTIHGLSKFDGKKFTNFTANEGLPSSYINCLLLGKEGQLWIGTSSGLSEFKNGSFKTFSQEDGLADNNILKLYQSGDLSLWAGSAKGISRMGGKEQKFTSYAVEDGLCPGAISSIFEDKNHVMWISGDNSLCRFSNQKFILYHLPFNLKNASISSIAEDIRGNLWVGTSAGLCRFKDGNFERFLIKKEANSNSIGCLYTDYEGNLWIGTHSGLYRYRSSDFILYNEKDGFANNFIFQVLRDDKGFLWVGTSGGGLYKFREGQSLQPFTKLDGLPDNNIYALAYDTQKNLWIGTASGLSRFDGKNFVNYTTGNGLQYNEIYVLCSTKNGALWIGGKGGVTLWDGNSFRKYNFDEGNSSGIVTSIFEDSKGNTWFGSYQGGLVRYDGKTFKDMRKELGLTGEAFMAINEDKEGNLYFGTFEGVYMFDGKRLNNFNEHDGLSSELVYNLTFENEKREQLWIGTNQGINKLEAGEFKRTGKKIIEPYGKEEGFAGVECNTNATFRDNDGSIWFGTVNGLIRYNPNEYYPNRKEPKLSFINTRIFYNDTLLPEKSILPYYLNNISFEYIGICLTNPEKVRYQYMLQGSDRSWSPVTKNNFATFSNLPPGKYVFKVRSCNNEGIWNLSPLQFSFSISAPFWKTPWFWTLTGITTLLIIILSVRYRIQQVKRRERKKLEQEIRIATNELKALRAQMNPHFIFNSLNSIQHFILTSDANSATFYLNKFAKLIRMILHNSERPTITISEELSAIKLYLELETLRFDNKFEYVIKIDPEIDPENFEIPSMLIQPYIENAIIHGLNPMQGKGYLEIRLKLTASHIVCTITDNGIGRKRSLQEKEHDQEGHKSMGMKITKDRLEAINAIHQSNLSVHVTDLNDQSGNTGTRVEIYIPLI